MIDDRNDICETYKGCEAIDAKGCSDCTVQVCVDNCPKDTSPWFAVNGLTKCGSGSRRISNQGVGCSGKGCDPEKACADACDRNDKCQTFVLDKAKKQCSLFSTCTMDYSSNVYNTVGYIRYDCPQQRSLHDTGSDETVPETPLALRVRP